MTELLLVRHALPASGTNHPGLAEEGVEQARRLGSWLKGVEVDTLIASPMRRAQETAAIVGEQIGHDLDATVDDLREWESDLPPQPYTALEEMAADDPRALAVAQGRYDDFVPELDAQRFRARVATCLEDVLTRWPSGRVVAVCHGGTINTMVAGLLGIPQLFWFHPGYTSITTVRRVPGGRTVVHAVNETAHLYASRD